MHNEAKADRDLDIAASSGLAASRKIFFIPGQEWYLFSTARQALQKVILRSFLFKNNFGRMYVYRSIFSTRDFFIDLQFQAYPWKTRENVVTV